MASDAQPTTTTGRRTIRAVPRDAMVARSAVNSLSVRLMPSPRFAVALVLDRVAPGKAGEVSRARTKIVIAVRRTSCSIQIVC